MNSVTQTDLKLAQQWYNEQKQYEGDEFIKTREFIDTQTEEGRKMVFRFINGLPPFPTEIKTNQILLSNSIMQLMYFGFHVSITQELFTSWHSDELIKRNEQLSDEFYIKHGEQAKFYHELEKSGAMEDLLSIVLQLKLEDKCTDENCKKILKICKRQVGETLLKGKMIKSLRGYD